MSKAVNNFLISLAIIFSCLFGFSACKGPLDDLTIDITAKGIEKVEGGYQTTLVLGDETTDRISVRADIGGAGGDVSKSVVWSTTESDKVQVSEIKSVGDHNYATIVGKSVTQFGHPAKITVSSIEKTSVNVTLFVNVVAQATKITPRNNTAIAVKGTVYEPNVMDFFTFSDDNDDTNVTVPNYNYELTVDGNKLAAGAKVPTDATEMTIRFIPSGNEVFTSSPIYSTQALEVESSKIILYENLETAKFDFKIYGTEDKATNENGVFELVINKDNGQSNTYYLSGLNPQTMNVSYKVFPESMQNCISIDYDPTTGEFSLMGQEETGLNQNCYVEFSVSYKDPSVGSKGKYVLPFAVVSYPDLISINGHITMDEDCDIAVYNNYVGKGESVIATISPFSTVYKNLVIKYIGSTDDASNETNLQWLIGDSTTPVFVDKDGITVQSGTKMFLLNVKNAQNVFGNGVLTFDVYVENAKTVSKKLNVKLDFGIEGLEIAESNSLDSVTGNFVLSLGQASQTEEVAPTPIKIKALPENAAIDSILDRYEVLDDTIVEVVDAALEGNVAVFNLKPLKAGTTSIVWTAPTGATYTQKVFVFDEFVEYSVAINGQQDVVGVVNYKKSNETEQVEGSEEVVAVDARDLNNQRIIESVRIATNSAIDLSNTLSPQNAYIQRIDYRITNANVVSYAGNKTNALGQLRTGDVAGVSKVSCIVYYYAIDGGNLVVKTKTISFDVYTYNKAKSLELSDSNLILYIAQSETGAEDFVYNGDYSARRVFAYVVSDGGATDVSLDNARWQIESSVININGPLQISGAFIRDDTASATEEGLDLTKYSYFYGSSLVLKTKYLSNATSRYTTVLLVSIKDYNTTLQARLTVTVLPFNNVRSASISTTNLKDFVVTQNNQSQQNKSTTTTVGNVTTRTTEINKGVEIYVEQDRITEGTYFDIIPTVRPANAVNQNLRYVIFDYKSDGTGLLTRSGEDYASVNTSKLVTLVDNNGAKRIVVNSDVVGEGENARTVYRSGRAVIYVLAEDSLKTKVEEINTFDDIEITQTDARPILLKIEIVVADGSETAYRIYNAQDFLKIYDQKAKNFEIMTDIYGVDLGLVVADGSFDTSFAGNLTSAKDVNGKPVVRTVTFKDIVISRTSESTTYNGKTINSTFADKDSLTAIFGLLTGTISNLNFVVPSYSYSVQTNAINDVSVLAYVRKETVGESITDQTTVYGKISDVSITVGTLNVDIQNYQGTGTASVGIIAQNSGEIKNLSVSINNKAIVNVSSYAKISMGVAKNNGTIDGLFVAGNVEIYGNGLETTVDFGGAICENFAEATASNIESTLNVTTPATIVELTNRFVKLQNVGGVVALNDVGATINDARYMVVDDGEGLTNYGLNINTATNVGGVVANNNGTIEYAYAVSFVDGFGIQYDSATNIAGVVGINGNTISKVFANISIIGMGTNTPVANGGTINHFYYNVNGATGSSIADASNILNIVDDEHVNVWGANPTYTSAYAKDNTYYYLLKDGEAYLPPVPSSLTTTSTHTVLESIGINNDNFSYQKVAINLSTFGGEAGSVLQSTTQNEYPMFNLFKFTETVNGDDVVHDGIFDLNCPPLAGLSALKIYVKTYQQQNVLRVIKGVNAKDYRVQILGNGTATLKIVSALNKNAFVYVQICVLNGYVSFKIQNPDATFSIPADDYDGTSSNLGTITLKQNVAEEFNITYSDLSGNISASSLGSKLEVSTETALLLHTYADSFDIVGEQPNVYGDALNLTKTWTVWFTPIYIKDGGNFVVATPEQLANPSLDKYFFDEDDAKIVADLELNAQDIQGSLVKEKAKASGFKTVSVNVLKGPTDISVNHGDLEIYAGDRVYTTLTVVTDDGFDGDKLNVYLNGTKYAVLELDPDNIGKFKVTYENQSNAFLTITSGLYALDASAGRIVFDLEYYMASPETVKASQSYTIKFEATAGESGTNVATIYNLIVKPQKINSIDMYHYIDIIQSAETGELSQAGEVPSANLVAGSFGLMKVTIDPSYVEFDRVEVRSDILVGGYGVTFDQRVFDRTANNYKLLGTADVSVDDNSISTRTKQTYWDDDSDTTNDFDGTFYFRTFISAQTPADSVFNIYVTVYDAQNNVLKATQKRYNIYASNSISMAYDNYVSGQNKAYVALNTGGAEDGDIYGQNANILTINAQAGLMDVKLSVANFDNADTNSENVTNTTIKLQKMSGGTGAELLTWGDLSEDLGNERVYVIVTKTTTPGVDDFGKKFKVVLEAKTYVSGILTTITREMAFEIVDFVINAQFGNPENSYVLSNAISSAGEAISNVSGEYWNYVFSTTPIQISAFATQKRGNLALADKDKNYILTNEVEKGEVQSLLRNIPEFSFDVNNIDTIKKVLKFLKEINNAGLDSQDVNEPKSLNAFIYLNNSSAATWPSLKDAGESTSAMLYTGDGENQTTGYYFIKGVDINKSNRTLANSFYASYTNGLVSFSSGASSTSVQYYNSFTIRYNEQNSKEHPIPIYTQKDLEGMQAGYSYILMNDITLDSNFVPLSTAIAGLDGNNWSIKFNNFKFGSNESSAGLFSTVNEVTILKNITIELTGNITIDCTAQGSDLNIGLLAGTNNGTITNCKVEGKDKTITLVANNTSNGIVYFGTLVGENQAYITNSRVENVGVSATYGVLGGFVGHNNSIISGCYVNSTNIQCDLDIQLDRQTMLGGFVAVNDGDGEIYESFVGGVEEGKQNETVRGVRISSNSSFGAFVYENSGTIADCYTSAVLNNKQQSIASGFVFTNSGEISRTYSTSIPEVASNSMIRPFVGTTQNSGAETANNNGTIEYSFYYEDVYVNYAKSFEVALPLGNDGLTQNQNIWSTYSFATQSKDGDTIVINDNGIWTPILKQNFGPKLINATHIGFKEGVHQEISDIESTESGAVYYYTIQQPQATTQSGTGEGEGASSSTQPAVEIKYNTRDCVALIASAEDFNNMFEFSDSEGEDICASDSSYYARIIRPIDLSALTANSIELKTTTKILRGKIVGNNMTIGGVDVSYLDKVQTASSEDIVVYGAEMANNTDYKVWNPAEGEKPGRDVHQTTTSSVGLFGEIRGGAISNLNFEVLGVYANNKLRHFVGGIAGRVVDGTLFNLTLTGDDVTVLGYNIVGGVAGIVLGDSQIANISVEGISVTSDFEKNGANEEKYVYNFDLARMVGQGSVNKADKLSIAGGLFGVVDMFETTNINKLQFNPNDTTRFTTLTYMGANTVLGQIAGGVVGVVGTTTILNNAHHIVANNSAIKASIYAGGLVGQNNGSITYGSVAYEENVQALVNSANTGAIVSNANDKLFNTISYTASVGGLVGANFGQTYSQLQSGSIRYSTSSVYVNAPNAQNVGGLVGVVYGGDIRAVYATGYVVGYSTASVGGLVGTIDEIKLTSTNINNKLNIPENLLVNVKNPYEGTVTLNSQQVLIDFAVAQNNWASAYYNRYATIQQYGYLGGFVGFVTNTDLFNTSHNGDDWASYTAQSSTYKADETVCINYYVNKIPQNPVAMNSASSYNGLELLCANVEVPLFDGNNIHRSQDDIDADIIAKTKRFAVGEDRNFACSQDKWDWFALWDEYSILGRNADDTPIIQLSIAPDTIEVATPKDMFKVYWHPDLVVELQNDINFKPGENQIQYIMAGTSTTPFSGVFKGNGYKISNIYVSNYLTDVGGLFGVVRGGTIQDVVISNVKIVNNHEESGVAVVNNKQLRSIGGLVGYCNSGTIQNVAVSGVDIVSNIDNIGVEKQRYVGGLVGYANNTKFANIAVEGVDKGIKLVQTEGDSITGTDNLFVGGLAGYANKTTVGLKVGKDDPTGLINVVNIDITNANIKSNTTLGGLFGYGEVVSATSVVSAGDYTVDGEMDASTSLNVAGIIASVNGEGNAIDSSYAYTTFWITDLQNATTNNTTISYDFVMEIGAKIEIPAVEVVAIDAEDASLTNTQIEEINAQLSNQIYSAVSIISNIGNEANKNILRFEAEEEKVYEKTEGENAVWKVQSTGTKNAKEIYFIPLDPFYSLATVDKHYNPDKTDLVNATAYYANYFVFDNETNKNKNGYIKLNNNVETAIVSALNKTKKLYYDNQAQTYGSAKILTGEIFDNKRESNPLSPVKIEKGEYYIITNPYGVDFYETFDEIAGFVNGHNYAIRTTAGTLAKTISGVITGVDYKFIANLSEETGFVEISSATLGSGTVIDLSTFTTNNCNAIRFNAGFTYQTKYGSEEYGAVQEGTDKTVLYKNGFNSQTFLKIGSSSVAVTYGNHEQTFWSTSTTINGESVKGIIANELTSSGVVNACGTTAYQNFNSKTIETIQLDLPENSVFGGIAGVSSGTINNCWSHIKYNILTSTNTSIFGGIVGRVEGGTVANLNYYGNILGKLNNLEQSGGIVGTAKENTTTALYKVMSYIFVYGGQYHITKASDCFNVIKDTVGESLKDTVYYYAINPDGGIGKEIGLADVLRNISQKSYRNATSEEISDSTITKYYMSKGEYKQVTATQLNDPNITKYVEDKNNIATTAFETYYGIWDKEIDGINFGLPTLKIEPKVASRAGLTREDAIEIPDEETFAAMLEAENLALGRYYILIKGDADSGLDNNVYDLSLVLAQLGGQASATTFKDNFSGHLDGNNKILSWGVGSTPRPLVNEITTGDLRAKDGKQYPAEIYNLTIINNSTGIPNLIANSNLTGEIATFVDGENNSYIKVNSTDITIDANAPENCGVLFGINEGTIENCTVSATITITDAGTHNIGMVAGVNRGEISKVDIRGTITSSVTSTDQTIGGVVGTNEGEIISQIQTGEEIEIKTTQIVYFVDIADSAMTNNVTIKEGVNYSIYVPATGGYQKGNATTPANDNYLLLSSKSSITIKNADYKILQIYDFEDKFVKFNTPTTMLKIDGNELILTNFTATGVSALVPFISDNYKYVLVEGDITIYDYFLIEENAQKFVELPVGAEIAYYGADGVMESAENNTGTETKYFYRQPVQNLYAVVLKNGTNNKNVMTYDVKKYARALSKCSFSNEADNTLLIYVHDTENEYGQTTHDNLSVEVVSNIGNNSFDGNTDYNVVWFAVVSGKVYTDSHISVLGSSAQTTGAAENYYPHEFNPTQHSAQITDAKQIDGINTATTMFVDVTISTSNIDCVGGIAGKNNKNGQISGMYVESRITAHSYVGGIVGFNAGGVSDCYAKTTITANSYVGGIAGQNAGTLQNSSVQDSTITATNTDSFAGGIAGSNQNAEFNNAIIVNALIQNTTITGNVHTAGVAGYNNGRISAGRDNLKGALELTEVTLNVTTDYEQYLGRTFNFGYITTENYGTIECNNSNTSLYFIDSVINVTFNNGYNNSGLQTNLNTGGVAGQNWGSINNIRIKTKEINSNNILSTIKLSTTFKSQSVDNKLNIGGIVGINEKTGAVRDIRENTIAILNGVFDGSVVVSNINISAQNSNGYPTTRVAGAVAENLGYISGATSTVTTDFYAQNPIWVTVAQIGGICAVNQQKGVIFKADYKSFKSGTIGKLSNLTPVNGGIHAYNTNAAGGIVGLNNGYVMACEFYGDLETSTSNSQNTGGIAGYNAGDIAGCYVGNSTVVGYENVGGVVGQNNNGYVTSSKVITSASKVDGNGIILDDATVSSSTTAGITPVGTQMKGSYTLNVNGAVSGETADVTPTDYVLILKGTTQTPSTSIYVKFKDDAYVTTNIGEKLKCEANSTKPFTGTITYQSDALVQFIKQSGAYAVTFNGTVIASGGVTGLSSTTSNTVDGYVGDSVFNITSGTAYAENADAKANVTQVTTKASGYFEYPNTEIKQISGTQTYITPTTSRITGYMQHLSDTSVQIQGSECVQQGAEITYGPKTLLTIYTNNKGTNNNFETGAYVELKYKTTTPFYHLGSGQTDSLIVAAVEDSVGAGTYSAQSWSFGDQFNPTNFVDRGIRYHYSVKAHRMATDAEIADGSVQKYVYDFSNGTYVAATPEQIADAEVIKYVSENTNLPFVVLWLPNGATIEHLGTSNVAVTTNIDISKLDIESSALSTNGDVFELEQTPATQTYETDCYSYYNNTTITHSAGTTVNCGITVSGNNPVTYTVNEVYENTNNKTIIKYAPETSVTRSLNSEFKILSGTDTFTEKTYCKVGNGAAGWKYKDDSVSITPDNFAEASTVTYNADTTEKFYGVVTYHTNSCVIYPAGTEVTYTGPTPFVVTNNGEKDMIIQILAGSITGTTLISDHATIATGFSFTAYNGTKIRFITGDSDKTGDEAVASTIVYNYDTHNATRSCSVFYDGQIMTHTNWSPFLGNNTNTTITYTGYRLATDAEPTYTTVTFPTPPDENNDVGEVQKTQTSNVTITGHENVGGAVGYNYKTTENNKQGTVHNVSVSNVTILTIAGIDNSYSLRVGGFVGYSEGRFTYSPNFGYYPAPDTENAEFSNCSVFNVEIKPANDNEKSYAYGVGGFAGFIESTLIKDCSLIGVMQIQEGHTIGGFVGQSGLGSNSYDAESGTVSYVCDCYMSVYNSEIKSEVVNNTSLTSYEGSAVFLAVEDDWDIGINDGSVTIGPVSFDVNNMLLFSGVGGSPTNDSQNVDYIIGHDPSSISPNKHFSMGNMNTSGITLTIDC